ncbi:MAG: hypothetical protein LBS21_03630 [Clostridiales bacterium]|jgi:hypothetical protein|nr:hypothetical protein [Clostridiales bacterium]
MKKSILIKLAVLLIVLLLAVMFIRSLAEGFRDPVVSMDGYALNIQSQSDGITVMRFDINSVRLVNEIPPLTRGDGFGFGNVQRGNVKVSNLGEGFAYVDISAGPFIYLELNGAVGNFVFINLSNESDTRLLYEDIQAWLQNT